jgi:methyl-accepting chemotaxis protein
MIFVAVGILLIARSELADARVEKAHAVADSTWGVAEYFQHVAETGAMTDAEARARFNAAASAVSYENHMNHLYIYDTETGICVVNAANPAFVGKDMRGVRDANGLPFARMMIEIAKSPGNGTIRYVFAAPGLPQRDKIAYAEVSHHGT